MIPAYADWKKLCLSDSAAATALCATEGMGWHYGKLDRDFYGYWATSESTPGHSNYLDKVCDEEDWNPIADRNDTDLLLARVESEGKCGAFMVWLSQGSAAAEKTWKEFATPNRMVAMMRLDPALVAWACCKAMEEA
jgi:hypothetical protein